MLELSTPVKYVKGVGPRIADVLAGKGIYTVGDLLYFAVQRDHLTGHKLTLKVGGIEKQAPQP